MTVVVLTLLNVPNSQLLLKDVTHSSCVSHSVISQLALQDKSLATAQENVSVQWGHNIRLATNHATRLCVSSSLS
jgi:hypothetical protein